MEHPPTIAAIDLGSNSFRLEIGFFRGSEFVRQHYIKRTLRQGACLENSCLSAAAMQAGWACLAEFGQLLHQHQVQHARAVATQTLREARNSADFVREGSRLLGGCPSTSSVASKKRRSFTGAWPASCRRPPIGA